MDNNYKIDFNSIMTDDNNLPSYVTVFINSIPQWYKIYNNDKGAYVIINKKRNYILESK